MSTIMKTIDWFLEPKPTIAVNKASDMNAQIREPPLSRPVTWASPIGKAI